MITLTCILLFLVSSAFLVWFFLKNDRGQKEPRGPLMAAAGFGVLAVLAAIWAEMLFVPSPKAASISVGAILISSLLIGIVEEVSKFLPLALFIRNKSYFNEHTDGIIYFGIAGLTFGFIENIGYLLFNNELVGGAGTTSIVRLIILFFFHAASTGIIGYYLAKAKLRHQSMLKPLVALAILALVHGLYDFLLFFAAYSARNSFLNLDENAAALAIIAMVSALMISALLNIFLFLYYRRAQQWDASVGLAVDPKLAAISPPNYPSAPYPPQTTNPPMPSGVK